MAFILVLFPPQMFIHVLITSTPLVSTYSTHGSDLGFQICKHGSPDRKKPTSTSKMWFGPLRLNSAGSCSWHAHLFAQQLWKMLLMWLKTSMSDPPYVSGGERRGSSSLFRWFSKRVKCSHNKGKNSIRNIMSQVSEAGLTSFSERSDHKHNIPTGI